MAFREAGPDRIRPALRVISKMTRRPAIETLIDDLHSDLPDEARQALKALILVALSPAPVRNEATGEALAVYLRAMDAEALNCEPATQFALNFLEMPNHVASLEFHANGRRQLEDSLAQTFQRCVIDRLFFESWPRPDKADPAGSETNLSPQPARPAQPFSKGQVDAILASYFGRERNYQIDRKTLTDLHQSVCEALRQAMARAGLSQNEQAQCMAQFEQGIGKEIRQLLSQLESKDPPHGFVHFLI